jgi:hypothetical protein
VQIQVSYPNFIQIGSSKKKFYSILSNSKPRNFSEFSFEMHFESEEVPMETVVPFSKTFTTIFYFKFLDLRTILSGSVKV